MPARQLTTLILTQWMCLLLASTSGSSIESNSSSTQVVPETPPLIETIGDNATTPLPDTTPPEAFFDNNYSEELPQETNITTEVFPLGPQFEAVWKFIGKETVRMNFSLFLNDSPAFARDNSKDISRHPRMVSTRPDLNRSIYALKYYLFTIRQYKTNTEKVLKMEQLVLKRTDSKNYDHFANSLLLNRLNPKERYSVCIYYYQGNRSNQMADLFICQDIMHDHLKDSAHGLIFVVTQYSVILGILVVLQSLYSMRKRRIAHIVHQHLINKTQRIRSTLSSVSLVRQSFSSMDVPPDPSAHDEHKLKKRIISSPAIVLSQPCTPPPASIDENEPFLRLPSTKNHVHFLLGLDENDDAETDSIPDEQRAPAPSEPYGDRPDALQSMAHILDTNKPWCRQSQSTLPV